MSKNENIDKKLSTIETGGRIERIKKVIDKMSQDLRSGEGTVESRENLQKDKQALELEVLIEKQNNEIEELLEKIRSYEKENQLLKGEIKTLKEALGSVDMVENYIEAVGMVQEQSRIIRRLEEELEKYKKKEEVKEITTGIGKETETGSQKVGITKGIKSMINDESGEMNIGSIVEKIKNGVKTIKEKIWGKTTKTERETKQTTETEETKKPGILEKIKGWANKKKEDAVDWLKKKIGKDEITETREQQQTSELEIVTDLKEVELKDITKIFKKEDIQDYLKEFNGIDGNKDIIGESGKKKAKEDFVKGKIEGAINRIEGMNDDKKKKIKEKIDYQKLTEFIIEKNQINKDEEENEKTRAELDQLKKETANKTDEINEIIETKKYSGVFGGIKKRFENIKNFFTREKETGFQKSISSFEKNIKEYAYTPDGIKNFTNEILKGLNFKDEEKEKMDTKINNLLNEIDKKTGNELVLETKERNLKRTKEENIKKLAEAFGLDTKNKEAIIDIADLEKTKGFLERKEGKKLIGGLDKLQKECFEKIKELEKGGNKTTIDLEVENMVKSKIDRMFKEKIENDETKKIIDGLKGEGYKKIAKSFIKEYEIEKKRKELNQSKENTKNKADIIVGQIEIGKDKGGFRTKVEGFETEIREIYNKTTDDKEKEKETENKKATLKEVLLNEHFAFPDEKRKGEIETLLNEIIKNVKEEREFKKEEKDLKEKNIKELAEMFGLDPKNEEAMKLAKDVSLGKNINKKAFDKATEKMSSDEKENTKGKLTMAAGIVGALGGGFVGAAGGTIFMILIKQIKEFLGVGK